MRPESEPPARPETRAPAGGLPPRTPAEGPDGHGWAGGSGRIGGELLGRVARVLAESGVDLSPDEFLDVLWLARHLPAGQGTLTASAVVPPRAQAAGAGATEVPVRPPEPVPRAAVTPGEAPPPPRPAAPERTDALAEAVERLVGLHASPAAAYDRPYDTVPARPVRTPSAGTARAGELQLSRSLRPLKLRVRDPHGWELDETATAEAMAEAGLRDAVLRPSRVRWLDVVLLVDDGTSMLLWQRLASRVKGLLERAGAFRTVRVLGLQTRAGHAPWLTHRPFQPGAAPLPPSTVTDPAGHTLLLVISDGAGAAWRDGRMSRQLEVWARSGPTAVLHALPPRLWDGSGIRAESWQVTTRRRGAPNAAWEVSDPLLPPQLAAFGRRVPVPVLAAEPVALARWAGLVASPGAGAVLPLLAEPHPAAPPGGAGTDAARAVLRFRESASAEAYRLAAHLAAVAPVSVPVMRLVQQALGPDITTGHLAEVFLGGLLRRTAEDPLTPQHRGYDFSDAARAILLGTAPAADLLRTSRRVADGLGRLTDGPLDLPAWLAHPEGVGRVAADGHPFTWLSLRLLRRLGIGVPQADAPDGTEPGEPPDAAPGGTQETAARADRQDGPTATGLSSDGEPLPDYVGAPGSEWLPLEPGNPRTAGSWRLFARHARSRTESGLFMGRAEDGTPAVLRLTRARSRARATLPQQAGALRALEGRQAPRLLKEGDTWLATEVFPGGRSPRPATSLATRLESDAPLSRDVFARVAQETATVLARAHALGVVHGGLSERRILMTGRLVCVTGWAVDEHPDGSAHDVQRLGTILLEIGETRLGGTWRSEPLRSLLRRCSSPVLDDRPTAAQLALSLRGFAADAALPPARLPALPPSVPIGRAHDGGRVVVDLTTMGPHGRIHGPFNVRAALLRTIVNGMLRRRYTPDETRIVLLGDARLYLDPAALNLRQITHYEDVSALARELRGELHRRRLLLGEARAARKASVAPLAGIVVVAEEPDDAAVRAWLDPVPAGLGVHVVVLDTAVSAPSGQGYVMEMGPGGQGRLCHPGAPGDGRHFRPLSFVPPTEHAVRLREEQRYAISMGQSGRVEEALAALRGIAERQQALLGPGHRDTLTSRYELGYLCLRSERLEEALELYRDTADGRMSLLGADHPQTLAVRQQCAYALGRMGRLDEACVMYRVVLESWQRTVGPEDQAALHCRHSLAAALNALGRHAEAVTEARAVAQSRRRELGQDAEDTLASTYQLIVALHGSGAVAEAAALAGELHARQLRVLGPTHPETTDIRRRFPEGRGGALPSAE